MRAKEITKHDAKYNRGRIMMAIDGRETEVRKVEAELNKHFSNTQCEEEGDNEGEISISYVIDRNEKKDFMFIYNEAKSSK